MYEMKMLYSLLQVHINAIFLERKSKLRRPSAAPLSLHHKYMLVWGVSFFGRETLWVQRPFPWQHPHEVDQVWGYDKSVRAQFEGKHCYSLAVNSKIVVIAVAV